jgi:hypothetical protein
MALTDISGVKPFYPTEPSRGGGQGRGERGRGGRGRGDRGGRGRGKPDGSEHIREREYYPSEDVVFLA